MSTILVDSRVPLSVGCHIKNSPPNRLSEIEAYREFVTYRISQIAARMSSHAAKVLRDECGLSVVQWRILSLLGVSAPVTSSVLVKLIAMDAGLFSRNLKKMVDAGLITSKTDPLDQRQQILRLTRSGKDQFEKAAPVMSARRVMLIDNISERDRQTFFKVLNQLEDNLEKANASAEDSGNEDSRNEPSHNQSANKQTVPS